MLSNSIFFSPQNLSQCLNFTWISNHCWWLVVFIQRFLEHYTSKQIIHLEAPCGLTKGSAKPPGWRQVGMQGRALTSAVLCVASSPSTAPGQWLTLRGTCMWSLDYCSYEKLPLAVRVTLQGCCFHQYPRHTWSMAKCILQHRTVIVRIFSSSLKLFPKLTGKTAPRLLVACSLPKLPVLPPIPYPSDFLPPFSSVCVTHEVPVPSHELHPPESEFQHHASLATTTALQPGPLFSCFPATGWGPRSAVVFWVSSWGGIGENTAIPNSFSLWHCTEVAGQHPYPVQPISHAILKLYHAVGSSDWL